MDDLTSTASRIMELCRYFRLKKGGYLSVKLLHSKRHLWQDVEEEDVDAAIDELVEKGFLREKDSKYGWRLLEAGENYLNQARE